MTTQNGIKAFHGTPAWFDMVGSLMMDAAAHAQLAPHVNVSLVERYIDGDELQEGLVQGLRFEIVNGKPTYRPGSYREERGDITVEVTLAASRMLNTLHAADPRFAAALASLQANEQFKVHGDLAQLGDWFTAVHDQIVDRTR